MERKLATVLFVDLVDSTELLSGVDPEIVRRRVSRFFDEVAHCIVTHGGTVEKFAGDAVMAAFGIPLAHEDDAERAVRAGLATLERVRELDLEARVGIESGEVVAEEQRDSTFATGEPVNIAARLQQEAKPGEILVGPGTASLVAGRVELEPLEPSSCGASRAGRRPPRRLRRRARRPALRSLAAPLVGRDTELELLENTFARTVRDRRASLVTIYGDPGVGKSRLAREFAAGLERATVLSGRCLPYGEGVTYWPLAEMVKASAGITDDDPLDEAQREDPRVLRGRGGRRPARARGRRARGGRGGAEPAGDHVGRARVGGAARGRRTRSCSSSRTCTGARSRCSSSSSTSPPGCASSRCSSSASRAPELLDVRPTWGGGRIRSTTLELEPLQPEESAELVGRSPRSSSCPSTSRWCSRRPRGTRSSSRRRSGCSRSGRAAEPSASPTRCRRSSPRASTGCRPRSACCSSARPRWGASSWAARSRSSRRRSTTSATRSTTCSCATSSSASRGRRSAASRRTSSGTCSSARSRTPGFRRARAPSCTAASPSWLKERAGDELVEIRAFHLDQAARLLAELDGAAPADLAEEAAAALTHAGRRALSREAFRSARKLLLRAAELSPTLERRYFAGRAAWRLGDMTAVIVEMEEVAAAARAAGERRLQGRALTALAEAVAEPARRRDHGAAARRAGDRGARDEPPDIRFEAFRAATQVASWLGDGERVRALGEARARGGARRRAEGPGGGDHERPRARLPPAARARRGRAARRARRRARRGERQHSRPGGRAQRPRLARDCRRTPAEAEAAFTAARELYAEIGNTPREATMTMMIGRSRARRGRARPRGEAPRDAVRTMKGLNDRARSARRSARSRGVRAEGAGSKRPSGTRSRRASRWGPTTGSRSRRRRSRSQSFAPRRDATTRRRSCYARPPTSSRVRLARDRARGL